MVGDGGLGRSPQRGPGADIFIHLRPPNQNVGGTCPPCNRRSCYRVWVKTENMQKSHIRQKSRKGKGHTLDTAPLMAKEPHCRSAPVWHALSARDFTVLPALCTLMRLSTNGINYACLYLPSRNWYSLPTPGRWKAELVPRTAK